MGWSGARRASLGALAAGVLMAAVGISAVPAQALPQDQVKRGEEIWKRSCARCHGEANNTEYGATKLDELQSQAGWEYVGDVMEAMENHKPVDGLPSISRQEAADVLAFLLQQYGRGDEVNGPLPDDDILLTPMNIAPRPSNSPLFNANVRRSHGSAVLQKVAD